MANPRVHEVAKELGLTSKEVLAHLDKIGEGVKSHASTITEDVAARLKADLSGNGAKTEKAPAKKTTAKKTPATKAPAPKVAPAAAPATGRGTEPAATPKAASTPSKAPSTASVPTGGTAASAPKVEPKPEPVAAVSEPIAAQPEPVPEPVAAAAAAVRVHRGITVKDFAEKIDRSPAEIVKTLIGLGEMVTVTQSMSDDAVGLVAEELGVEVQVIDPEQEEAEESFLAEVEEDEGKLVARPPVVTVMGHVDHGKTAILDAIRKTEVAAGEAGGITQHIGAYQVHHDGREVTFIDTPGHAAFTAMRARGAQTTDVVVLVVAADDGVMPQTVEAIDHAKAAGVPIIVAVNKVDKPEADPARVRQQLSDHDLLPEEWGGDTVYVDVSAKQRTNLDTLIEMILLTSDVQLDLKANPEALARGVVIEAHLDKGRGPVATVLIKRGTLYQGDPVVAGAAWGRVRAMLNERSEPVEEAKPGQPVEVLGWQSVPEAGDDFHVEEDEREARAIAGERAQHRREAEIVAARGVSLQSLLAFTREGEVPELAVVLKADTQGSIEALDDQMTRLDQSLVKINVVRKGVGGITENDVTLAQASNAIIIGFNVVENAQARTLAEEAGVDIRSYRVIYQAVEDIQSAAKGLLGPELREVPLGQAEVRATFRVPKLGVIAGCMVLDGVIKRNAKARLVRDGTVIYESTVVSLRRFKDDAREVQAGYECGIGIDGFQDLKEGDLIQAFEEQEVAR
ncbi:MAG: translation initiation factor [Actinomycetota bacterium]|jgi:translation initiation factor IF-2|nr:translation initiation factor [Actinomycetota bacterium]